MGITLVKKELVINSNAIELLEELLVEVKAGNISSIACCYITKDKDTGGAISEGEDTLLMWAGMMHMERNFYDGFIKD